MGVEKNKAMVVLQKIAIAIFLGVVGWLSLSTVSCRDRILKLETQLEERVPRQIRTESQVDQLAKDREEILRALIEQKDTEKYLSRRLDYLEKEHKP